VVVNGGEKQGEVGNGGEKQGTAGSRKKRKLNDG